MTRILPAILAICILLLFLTWANDAPENLPEIAEDWEAQAFKLPFEAPPFGNDGRGRPLIDYARQGAAIVVWPAVMAGLLVACFATLGGVLRAVGWSWMDRVVLGFGEVVGSLPRMVVVLIMALMMDRDHVSLMPMMAHEKGG